VKINALVTNYVLVSLWINADEHQSGLIVPDT